MSLGREIIIPGKNSTIDETIQDMLLETTRHIYIYSRS